MSRAASTRPSATVLFTAPISPWLHSTGCDSQNHCDEPWHLVMDRHASTAGVRGCHSPSSRTMSRSPPPPACVSPHSFEALDAHPVRPDVTEHIGIYLNEIRLRGEQAAPQRSDVSTLLCTGAVMYMRAAVAAVRRNNERAVIRGDACSVMSHSAETTSCRRWAASASMSGTHSRRS